MTTTAKTEDKTKEGGERAPQPQPPQRASNLPVKREQRPGALAPALGTFGPLSLIRRLFDDLERLTAVGVPDTRRGDDRERGGFPFVPAVEVRRRGDKLVVNVDLPGLSADDIRITADDGALIIEGERRSEHEEQDGDVWRCERSYGQFQRTIPLPEGADPTSIEARFDNGVLEISVRAPEQKAQRRQIDIQTSSSGASSDKSKQTTSH
jgi:HSP20 family protein